MFDFLGFTVRRRGACDKKRRGFASFQPAASKSALNAMCEEIRTLKLLADSAPIQLLGRE
jgi:hypothetical protein